MSAMKLTKTRLFAGVWEGVLTGVDGDEKPELVVTHLGDALDGVNVTRDASQNQWLVTVPVPVHLITDGVQTFVISSSKGEVLNSFMLLSGEALAEDIRAEVALLRAELNILKKAFRRQNRDVAG